MIILEGPDGGGKTTLSKMLNAIYGFQVRKRDDQSAFLWSISEMSDWTKPYISLRVYDRFPLIGEYIYGPVWRGGGEPEFLNIDEVRERFLQDTLIIYCRPNIKTILRNCSITDQTRPKAKDPDIHEKI